MVNRLYREMGLQLRNKTPKRKVKAKLREDRQTPVRRNDVWPKDFVHDQLFDGHKIRVPHDRRCVHTMRACDRAKRKRF